MNRDLQLALELADAADAITMKHFQSTTLAVRTKLDKTPVSEADEAVERMIRERLATECPEDSVVGEEFGTTGSGLRRWILDPIDGTKNYVRGIPVFGTLIGLEDKGRLIVGVVSAPALSRRWWASAGEGAFCSAAGQVRQIRASAVEKLEDAHLTYDSLTDFDQHGGTVRFLALLRRCTRARGFGDFWAHMLVAEGAVEIAIEPAVAAWDMAAVQIIVEEAGGRFSDLQGNARCDGGSGLSTNGPIHDTVLEFFR
ncbi:MAG TPA: histidinol-phosphatase [Thermoanaerobaculia bacterium]|jgi:histidinol-phosphatase